MDSATTAAATPPETTSATPPAQPAGAAPAAPPQTDKASAPKASLLASTPPGDKQGQSAGENKTTPAAGAELEVTLPDGVQVEAKTLDAFKALAKEAGLTSESASKFVAMYAEQAKAAAETQMAAFRKQADDWEQQLLADKEFGGQNLKASQANLERARAMSPEAKALMTALDSYGLGNLPDAVRFFNKYGASLAEDTTSGPTAKGFKHPANESPMEKLARVLTP